MNKDDELAAMRQRHTEEIAALERKHRIETGEPTYEDLVWQLAEERAQFQQELSLKDQQISQLRKKYVAATE